MNKPLETDKKDYMVHREGKYTIYAKFRSFNRRAVICNLAVNHKNTSDCFLDNYYFRKNKAEGKALCHSGNPELNLEPDEFKEEIGMGLAYVRARKLYFDIIEEINTDIGYYEEKLQNLHIMQNDLINAFENMDTKVLEAVKKQEVSCRES